LLLVVGEADGLVYVGREKFFTEQFESLSGESEFVLLKEGKTFKSQNDGDLLPTGHNIFDKLDERGKYETYNRIFEFIVGKENIEAWDLKFESMERLGPRREMIRRILNQYANNFVFREYVNTQVEFVKRPTPALEALVEKKKTLAIALRKSDGLKKKFDQESTKLLQAQKRGLAKSLGLSDQFNPDQLEWELSLNDMTAERAQELQKYVESFRQLELEHRSSWVDPHLEAKNKLLQDLGVESYEAAQKESRQLEQDKSGDKSRRSELSRGLQKYTELEKQSRRNFSDSLNEKAAELEAPVGVDSVRAASRELKVEMNSEKRQALTEYRSRLGDLNKSFAEQRANEFQTQILSLEEWPEGYQSLEQIRSEVAVIDRALADKYVPEDAPQSLKELARDIEVLDKEIALIKGSQQSELVVLQKQLQGLKKKKDQIVRRLQAYWTKTEIENPVIKEAIAREEAALEKYYEVYQALSEKQSNYLIDLSKNGEISSEALANPPEEIKAALLEFSKYREIFEGESQRVRDLFFQESVLGRLDQEQGEKPSQWLAELVGGPEFLSTGKLGESSLEFQIRATEEKVDGLTRRLVALQMAVNEARYEYHKLMAESGDQQSYFKVEKVVLKDFLNQPIDKLMAALEDGEGGLAFKALEQSMSTWEEFWVPVLRDEQLLPFDPLRLKK
jgi:hypothetical protein